MTAARPYSCSPQRRCLICSIRAWSKTNADRFMRLSSCRHDGRSGTTCAIRLNPIDSDNSHSYILSRRLGMRLKCRPFDLRSRRTSPCGGMSVPSFLAESLSALLHGYCTRVRRVSGTYIVVSYFACKAGVRKVGDAGIEPATSAATLLGQEEACTQALAPRRGRLRSPSCTPARVGRCFQGSRGRGSARSLKIASVWMGVAPTQPTQDLKKIRQRGSVTRHRKTLLSPLSP
jgi:hypothetical protein